jgi:hypothetical protein
MVRRYTREQKQSAPQRSGSPPQPWRIPSELLTSHRRAVIASIGAGNVAVCLLSAYPACCGESLVIDVLIHAYNLGDQWLALTRTQHPH